MLSLTGKPLFYGLNYQDLLEKNRKGVIKFANKSWAKVSSKGNTISFNSFFYN